MAERVPPISVHLATVRAKDRERAVLQADIDAFLRRKGNRIQVLESHLLGKGLQLDYREQNDAMAQTRTRDRRRRRQDEEE